MDFLDIDEDSEFGSIIDDANGSPTSRKDTLTVPRSGKMTPPYGGDHHSDHGTESPPKRIADSLNLKNPTRLQHGLDFVTLSDDDGLDVSDDDGDTEGEAAGREKSSARSEESSERYHTGVVEGSTHSTRTIDA